MIELKNLRLEKGKEWTKLVADISSDRRQLPDDTLWFALPNENAYMFTDETYDPFVLALYYWAMVWNEDVKICGKMSKKLYKNITSYISQIYNDFSKYTNKVKLSVEGFVEIERIQNLVGASGSFGIDALCTLFDHYKEEEDPEYKISALFLFNCGSHKERRANEPKETWELESRKIWLERVNLNKKAAEALQIPLYPLDSNLHVFASTLYQSAEAVLHQSFWSSIFCLQKVVKKYYVSGSFTYQQVLSLNKFAHDVDLSEYAEPIILPLLRTEAMEIVLEGAQYTRIEKILRIADWDIAQRFLNVCVKPLENGKNCTINCVKCREVMLVLEAIGKTKLFSSSFDVDLFYREIKKVKINTVARYYNEYLHSRLSTDFARAHGMKMPPFLIAAILHAPRKIRWIKKQAKAKKIDKRL